MTIRLATAAAIVAFTGLAGTAQAAPSCLVEVQGMTVNQCPADVPVAYAPRGTVIARTGTPTEGVVETTGSIVQRPVAR